MLSDRSKKSGIVKFDKLARPKNVGEREMSGIFTVRTRQHTQPIAVHIVFDANGTCFEALAVRLLRRVSNDRNLLEHRAGQPVAAQASLLPYALGDHQADHDDEAQSDHRAEWHQQVRVDVERRVAVQDEREAFFVQVTVDDDFAGGFAHKHRWNVNVIAVVRRHWLCAVGRILGVGGGLVINGENREDRALLI